jgi:hypothetical protein
MVIWLAKWLASMNLSIPVGGADGR